MEKLNELEQKWLIEELTQGKELASQLQNQISPKTSKETCEHLVQKILSSYDKALEFLSWGMLMKQDPSPVVGLVDSSLECSDGVSSKRGRAKNQHLKSKRRKTMVRSEQVLVIPGRGVKGALEDGYSWRKYGQKGILGTTHPRAYYRCTHRHTRGCMATKQVQRSDDDSTMVEVIYNGNHKCLDASFCEKPNDIVKQGLETKQTKEEKDGIFKFGQNLKVENEPLIPPFSPIQSENQSNCEKLEEGTILSYSPSFLSPSTSGSNYLTTSPSQMNLNSIEFDLSYIASTISSVKNLPCELDLPVEIDFDPDVEIENIECYFE